MTGTSRVASRAARVGAAIVASGAAALSFRGTADFAEKSHAVDPGWGWLVPLVVEAGVLTAAAIAWVRSGDGVTARVETTVMASLLALSVVINIAHAANATLLGHAVAAAPPLVLLVAVEGLLREQRRAAVGQRRHVSTGLLESADDVVPVEMDSHAEAGQEHRAGEPPIRPSAPWPIARTDTGAVESHPAALADQRAPAVAGANTDVSAQAILALSLRDHVLKALDGGIPVTGAAVGSWLDVSESTGLRRLRELRLRDPELDARMRRASPLLSVGRLNGAPTT